MNVKKCEEMIDHFYNDIVRGDVNIGQKAQDSYDSILGMARKRGLAMLHKYYYTKLKI